MDKTPASPEELLNFFNQSSAQKAEAQKPENLRYVIYARKSTDESSDKQVRSIGDQIAECKAMADKKGLNVVKIIKESESAKEPDIREGFREMVEGVKEGKYEGIIAWHPDRLARNMKDAGEIIDLIDKNIIGHLDFVNFTFVNDTSGKMLLGITFVLSKQYSDALSDNVNRGIRRSIEEGKFLGRHKHGYTKDKNQFLRPNSENFVLLKKAWDLRMKGKTLDDIAEFLNSSGYKIKKKDGATASIFTFNKKHLSTIFSDPFYCGVLSFGQNLVNLNDVYDFIPMIDTGLFCSLNKIDEIKVQLNRVPKKTVKAELLRGKVLCDACGRARTSSITTKKMKDGTTKKIFYYKCETRDCKFYGKSIRAKAVIEFVEEFLERNDFAVREIYDYFKKDATQEINERLKSQESRRRSLSQSIAQLKTQLEGTKKLLAEENDEMLKNEFKSDLKLKLEKIKEFEKELEDLKTKKEIEKLAILEFQDFLELFRLIPSRLRKVDNMKTLDETIQIIFSNFTVDTKKVQSYKLNTPFKEVLERRKCSDRLGWSG